MSRFINRESYVSWSTGAVGIFPYRSTLSAAIIKIDFKKFCYY